MVKNQFKEDMVKIISKKVWYKIGQDVSSMQQHMIWIIQYVDGKFAKGIVQSFELYEKQTDLPAIK